MGKNNNRAVGAAFEQMAADYLESLGMCVTDRNYFCRGGEIDIVARDNAYIVFCEVKYRRDTRYGYPEEAVDALKAARIRRTAAGYMLSHHISENTPVRFDVISVLGNKINHIKDAF